VIHTTAAQVVPDGGLVLVQFGSRPPCPSSPLQITSRVCLVSKAPHVVLQPLKSAANQSYLTHAGVALQTIALDGFVHDLLAPVPVHVPTLLSLHFWSVEVCALAPASEDFCWHSYASDSDC
jgi:hypothetical protein